MTAPTPQMEWAQQLKTAIEQAGGHGIRPARHVLARLAALLYPHEVKHIDVDLKPIDGHMMRVSGTITVITDQLVAVAAVNDMLAMGTGPHQTDMHQSTGVEITVVPRSSLQRVAMVPAGTEYADHNNSADWHANAGDFTVWPYAGRVSFVYAGLAEPVVMPSGGNAEEFRKLLPALMADLSQ